MSDADFLRSLAQNDYMIDKHVLPSGQRLMEIAHKLDIIAASVDDAFNSLLARNLKED